MKKRILIVDDALFMRNLIKSILEEAASKARQEEEMILSRGEQEAKQQFQKIISDARIRSKKRSY